MAPSPISRLRLVNQRLAGNPCTNPAEIVRWLGAVQAQDFSGAKWALGLRVEHATDASIEQAFNAGAILRTHVLRPTWHFVAPQDIRWLLALTAPRVHAASAYMYRRHGMDDALFARSGAAIVQALQGNRSLTRAELGAALSAAGIPAEGNYLAYLIMHAELDALICSGPRRGKQFTYALLTDRAPQAVDLPREEALAELTRRYFTGHGPATLRDFAWWSGLTLADAKAGLAMAAAHLAQVELDGKAYWFSPASPPDEPAAAGAPDETTLLLPTYDEFLVGYTAFDQSRRGGPGSTRSLEFDATLVAGGQVVGTWRRTLHKGALTLQLAPFVPFTPAEDQAFRAAAQRYSQFSGLPVVYQAEKPPSTPG